MPPLDFHHRTRPQPKRAAGFTLVELLTVLAVMTLLLGAAVPAFNGFGGAANLTGAGLKVEGLFAAARQNAISKGVPTAVVVLTSGGNEEAYRTLAAFELRHSAGRTDKEWFQVQPWQTLPAGVVIHNDSEASHFLQANSASLSGLPAISYLGQSYEAGTGYAYQIFLPSGRLKSPPIPCNLTLIRGQYENNTLRNREAGNANYFSLFFVDATGEAKITRP